MKIKELFLLLALLFAGHFLVAQNIGRRQVIKKSAPQQAAVKRAIAVDTARAVEFGRLSRRMILRPPAETLDQLKKNARRNEKQKPKNDS